MGDLNQKLYLKKFLPEVEGPVLEIGSKDYGNVASFRDQYADNEYVGVDMEEGDNVDHVINLVEGVGELPCEHFALGICCSVLEHVTKPWVMAENITALIRPGGQLFMSVPWVFKYHAYPDDYYRFSWSGIATLFPAFTWEHTLYSTNLEGEFFQPGSKVTCKHGELGGIAKETERGDRYYLPKLMINMLGTKVVQPTQSESTTP